MKIFNFLQEFLGFENLQLNKAEISLGPLSQYHSYALVKARCKKNWARVYPPIWAMPEFKQFFFILISSLTTNIAAKNFEMTPTGYQIAKWHFPALVVFFSKKKWMIWKWYFPALVVGGWRRLILYTWAYKSSQELNFKPKHNFAKKTSHHMHHLYVYEGMGFEEMKKK